MLNEFEYVDYYDRVINNYKKRNGYNLDIKFKYILDIDTIKALSVVSRSISFNTIKLFIEGNYWFDLYSLIKREIR